ncbi:mediator complex subunit MED14-domain-containing protein [Mycena floridula]|nr:mediator complex subunit MED14-domain-containing protein [Mycena floridula]
MNGESSQDSHMAVVEQNNTNGIIPNGIPEPTVEELEMELPFVDDGQVPLSELLSRVVQAIYAELSELAETMPNMSDSARKRTLADWVVKIKKQVVKLYAVAKWSRDADTVQKCMNITAFLMNQNRQFEDAIVGLNYARDILDPARLRNHDLLTSLDVLTTGSYRRLPTVIKKMIIPPPRLTDAQIVKTLTDMEDVIRFRLQLSEVIPVEMLHHRIADGRVYFTAPKMFEVSLCLRGAEKDDGWFFVNVKFLLNVGGDMTGIQEFPKQPTGHLKRFIADEADAQLARYLPMASIEPQAPGVEVPPRPQLPEGVVDTPLIRVYNFLQMMSLSYQLEILWYQAQRMRSLGWGEYLNVSMSPDRKKLVVSYWLRRAPPASVPPRRPSKIPLLGGTLTISITESQVSLQRGGGAIRSPRAQALADLQLRSKLGQMKPSDTVEALKFEVLWEPAKGAFGVNLPPEDTTMEPGILVVNADDLDFESLLKKVLYKHTTAILTSFQVQCRRFGTVFAPPGVVTLVKDDLPSLRVHLCADEVVFITIDSRTGRLNLRDTGDLAAAGRAPRFMMITRTVNDNPNMLLEALVQLRFQTILGLADQKAKYLGLQSFRQRNFMKSEELKLGTSARGFLYIQLANFVSHYLVIVITDESFRYALITTQVLSETMYANMIMEDVAWLDFGRIHGEEGISVQTSSSRSFVDPDSSIGMMNWRNPGALQDNEDKLADSKRHGFDLDTQVLRELYSYCCARVAYMNVERQFKLRSIPFTHVNPTSSLTVAPELRHIQSSLARSVPALCVQSADILSGAPAAEAAMQNIRVIPLNWWSERNAQVVTCVKLKYVQQPMGKKAGSSSTVIRPSKRIIYDTTEAVVSFLSENVNTCVDEFLEEWAKVSKMVVIAREIAQMGKQKNWSDVRLLSFDLQTVQFAYAADYAVSISCEDQLSLTGGNFDLRFSRCKDPSAMEVDLPNQDFNPHDDAEPFLRNILHHGAGRLAPSLQRLVGILRATLPIVKVLEEIRCTNEGDVNVDTFAKAAGWYRMLYGDLSHALDFRIMSDERVAILDASHSLFSSSSPTTGPLTLQPIPRFEDIILTAVADSGAKSRSIASIDVGLICDGENVGGLAWAIHKLVVARLADVSTTMES